MMGPLGADLDNTIISYDDLISRVAKEMGLIYQKAGRGKKAIRDAIRKLSDGEVSWQRLQAEIYGPRMSEARMIEGVDHFFNSCRNHSVETFIVSHKTSFANYDKTGTNLRDAAMAWLERNGFFNENGMGLSRENVFFESTRREKIERIKSLGCAHFIDDLEETFLEGIFPESIEKILYDPHHLYTQNPNIKICNTWMEITAYFFPPIP